MKLSLVFNIGGVKPRQEEMDGRKFLVVPTVAMVEGVLNGSEGPLLYRGPDMEKSVPVWNHRPLVVYHPRRGQTAATPETLAKRGIGLTLNSSYSDGKLKMESWIDIEKCKRIDNRILESIENGTPVEVSTGLNAECTLEKGEHNGVEYKGIVFNYQPDHLAILPDQIGACSVAKGAGLLQNADGGLKPLDKIVCQQLMALTGTAPIFNERSQENVKQELYSLIQARYGYSCYIEAVFDDWFVYCYDGKSYKLSYQYTDQEVTIAADPVEVYSTVKYVTVNGANLLATVANHQLVREKSAMKEIVTRIIANSKGAYEESDRAMLEAMPDAKLEKLEKSYAAPAPAPVAPQNVQNPPAAPTLTQADWERNAPPEVTRLIANMKTQEANERAQLVPIIMNAPGNAFTEAWLKDEKQCSIDLLRGIAGPIIANQRGQGQGPQAGPPQMLQNNYAGAWTPQFGYGAVQNTAGNTEEEADEFERPTLEFSK